MFRPTRTDDRPVRFLDWRIRLAGSGAILAAFGIAADVELLRWLALAVLLAAAVLGIVASRRDSARVDGDPAPED